MPGHQKPFEIVIEGAGSVVDKFYLPALQRLRTEGVAFRITFVDDSQFWNADSRLVAEMNARIAKIRALGVYLDKSEPVQFAQWRTLRPETVVIATPDRTHVAVTLEWLNSNTPPNAIYIEKPLDASIGRARELLGVVGAENPGIRAFDHYRAKLLPSRAQFDMLSGFLKAGIARFTFYFLEDLSGADPAYETLEGDRQGPIENENRVAALRDGLLLDLMPHVIAVLAHFGDVNSMVLTRLRVGTYTGVDGDVNKPSEIAGETFAEARFLFRSHQGTKTEGVAYIGKGVRGVRALGPDYDRATKLLLIEDQNGRKVKFDFRKSGAGSPSQSVWIDERGEERYRFDLHDQPYYVFLRSITSPDHSDDRIGLPIEVGKRTLEVIDELRYPISEKLRSGPLPTYPCGIYQKRDSLHLEDVLAQLPMLYGQ